jgi:hypothetical protein
MWLHRLTDVPPPKTSEAAIAGSAFKDPPVQNNTGSDAPYLNNLGGVMKEYERNLSIARPRGWGEGNNIFSAPHEEGFYTQPGHPLDPRNEHTKPGKPDFTLKDTAEDVLRRNAEALALHVSAKEADGAVEPEPTFSAAAALTPAEEAAWKASVRGQNERWLQERMVACAEMIEEYDGVPVEEAEDAVADAKDELAAYEKQYAALKAARAKM